MITRDRYNQELNLLTSAIDNGEIDLSKGCTVAYYHFYPHNELTISDDSWTRADFNQVFIAIEQGNREPLKELTDVEKDPNEMGKIEEEVKEVEVTPTIVDAPDNEDD